MNRGTRLPPQTPLSLERAEANRPELLSEAPVDQGVKTRDLSIRLALLRLDHLPEERWGVGDAALRLVVGTCEGYL
jgi:hypothetical protein